MVVLAEYPVDVVFDAVGSGKAVFSGVEVRMNSQRYRLFKNKGCKCVKCGLVGNVFRLERDSKSNIDCYHFNLYHRSNSGKFTLMTKDHIVPRSKGGSNTLDNYQTMCIVCNNKKADTFHGESL